MSPSQAALDRVTLPESVKPHDKNSPLNLYIDFHNVLFFIFVLDINIDQLIKFNHKCMHSHLNPNIAKYSKYKAKYSKYKADLKTHLFRQM